MRRLDKDEENSMKALVLAFCSLASVALAQNIYVDQNAQAGGNGSSSAPFKTIGPAVTYANSLTGTPTIRVAPGRYEVDATLNLQKTVTFRGSNVTITDSQGLSTGAVQTGTEARIVGTVALGSNPLLVVGKDGQVIPSLEIRELTFEAGPGNGDIMDLKRVQNFMVRDSIFRGSMTLPAPTAAPGISTFASSGEIRDNYMTSLLAGGFLSAGYPASPATVMFRDNRIVGNRNGVLLIGTSDGIPEAGNQLNATVRDNDISGNVSSTASTAIRIMVKGNEALGDTGLFNGQVTAMVRDNRLVGNTIGIALDAGFPYRVVPPANTACDIRQFGGTLDITFTDNQLSGSTRFGSLISFTREQARLGQTPQSQWQYLHNATYVISDSQHSLAGADLDFPALDPIAGGPCIADLTHELLSNTLIINGVSQTNSAP
jgi:Protein of unknown function (DUF1565)